jgi:hypothetical protein
VVELGDRLRATAEVTIALNEDGSIRLRTPEALAGATFVLPQEAEVRVSGHPPKTISQASGETTFTVDLPAGDTTITLTTATGERHSFFGPPPRGATAAVDRLSAPGR